ncbi:MAG: sensor histidine kinase, partial [Nitriliruptoraceae bacterium]
QRRVPGGPGAAAAGRLAVELRRLADDLEDRVGVRVEVLVPDDLPALAAPVADAVLGAVTEALTNVGKHAAASRVVVYAEPGEEDLLVSVRDDGVGFDPQQVTEGLGITASIRERIATVGGRADLRSEPGGGCEVQLRLPSRP